MLDDSSSPLLRAMEREFGPRDDGNRSDLVSQWFFRSPRVGSDGIARSLSRLLAKGDLDWVIVPADLQGVPPETPGM